MKTELDNIIEQMESARDKQLVDYLVSTDFNNVSKHKDMYESKHFYMLYNSFFFLDVFVRSYVVEISLKIIPSFQTQEILDYCIINTILPIYSICHVVEKVKLFQTPEILDKILDLGSDDVYIVRLVSKVHSFQTPEVFLNLCNKLSTNPDYRFNQINFLTKVCPKFQEWIITEHREAYNG